MNQIVESSGYQFSYSLAKSPELNFSVLQICLQTETLTQSKGYKNIH